MKYQINDEMKPQITQIEQTKGKGKATTMFNMDPLGFASLPPTSSAFNNGFALLRQARPVYTAELSVVVHVKSN